MLGAGLSLHLVLFLSFPNPPLSGTAAIISYTGDSASTVSIDPSKNFISKIISWVRFSCLVCVIHDMVR